MQPLSSLPLLSVVIVSYNMNREIPRTVQSFLPPYQQDMRSSEIEIIVMENGSSRPISPDIIKTWPENVKYVNVQNPQPSPAQALNVGVQMARGEWVCPVIDGARMVTGGVFKSAKMMMRAHRNPVISTIGYHLGSVVQQENVKNGYDQATEDRLLASIRWPENPYRLFDIACLGSSAEGGWFKSISESNVLILKKVFYESLLGYDEAFNIPGGGLVNLDFFKRCVDHPASDYILLLGEGSFHQYHGGVTTSRPVSERSSIDKNRTTWDIYAQQYKDIRGEPYSLPKTPPILYGQASDIVKKQTLKAARFIQNHSALLS